MNLRANLGCPPTNRKVVRGGNLRYEQVSFGDDGPFAAKFMRAKARTART